MGAAPRFGTVKREEKRRTEPAAAEAEVHSEGRSVVYRLWQVLILIIRAVTPLAYLYFGTVLYYRWSQPVLFYETVASTLARKITFSVLSAWMLGEALWFPWYIGTVERLQLRKPSYHATHDYTSREDLVVKCMHALQLASTGRNTTDHQARIDYLRKVIEGWFLGADFFSIKRENFQSWVAWAFLDEDLALLDKENRHQVDKLTKIIERACEHSFPPGNNPDLKCIRLTLDAVQATHRPLIYYIVCKSVNALSHLLLRGIGFRLRELQRKHVPGSGKLTYLYRPAKEPMPEGALPIVFIHGIGIGFAAYVPFLLCLPRNVPVYLLEWPHVSMQLTEEVPTIEETMAFLVAMLDTDQQEKATFVAHSLGTIAVAWMLRSESHRQRVGSVVLLDPVTFVLCDPTIAYNFLHRPPSNSLELIMQYFVSREMYIANSLSRHFHWSKNILFYDNLPHPQDGLKHVVSLSGVDAIVPSPRVKLYLDTCAEMDGYRNPVDVIYHDEQNHGEMLFRLPFLRLIMERIREACGSIPSQPPMSVSGEFQSPPQSFVNTPKSVKSSPPHNMKLRSHARRPAASPSPVASVDAAAPVVVTSTATSRGRSNSKAPRLSVIA